MLIPAYRHGFRVVFVVGAALAAAAFAVAGWLMPQVELGRVDDEELKEEGKLRIRGNGDEERSGEK